ncbi:MAG: hypothetical protein MJ094_01705 [Saccharofermentans sp.]|nr:hypothetical protein [Saccharofermentans sp.]
MKRKILAAVLAASMCMGMAACAKEEEDTAPVVISGGEAVATTVAEGDEAVSEAEVSSSSDAYYVRYNGMEIHMNQPSDEVISALGDDYSYFEAPSCAYEGMDRIYTYSSIAVYCYTMDGVDYISSVQLRDDTVATVEGIRVGDSSDSVYATYGEDGVQGTSGVEFFKGDSILAFVFEGGNVIGITYTAIVG